MTDKEVIEWEMQAYGMTKAQLNQMVKQQAFPGEELMFAAGMLSDADLAQQRLEQAQKMEASAKQLLEEAQRLKLEAEQLSPKAENVGTKKTKTEKQEA